MERKKTMATLTALSALLTTGCTVDIDEKKLTEKLGEFGITVRQDGDNVEANIAETTLPIVTTTETTSSVTTSTEKTTYTTALAKTTTVATTYQTTTSEEQKPITMRTHETRGPVPTYTTTTNTTPVYTTVVEEQPTEKSYKIGNQPSTYNNSNGYLIKDKYIAQPTQELRGKKGEFLYSIVRKLYGNYNEDSPIVKGIIKANDLTDNFIPEGQGITIPGKKFVYYYSFSAVAVENETEFPMEDIKRFNSIEDENQTLGNRYMLAKVLSDTENTFKTPQGTAHICGTAAVIAEDYIHCGKTYEEGFVDSAIIKNPDDATEYYFVQAKPEGGYCSYLVAKNAHGMGATESGAPYITINGETTLYPLAFANEAKTYATDEKGALYSWDDDLRKCFKFPIIKIVDLRTGKQKVIG